MITSCTNSQIKFLSKLMSKSKARREEGVFVVEGWKMFLETPDNSIKKVFLSNYSTETWSHDIIEKIEGLERNGVFVEEVSNSVYKAVSDTVSPQGVLAIVNQPKYSLDSFLQSDNPLFIVLENIQDPGNLGTIIRTAEGAGVTAVIMNKGTVDLFNPKVVRSTMGAIFRVPFIYSDDLSITIRKLKECNINTYAAHLTDSVDYIRPSYKEGTAILIGNEGNGLSVNISSAADYYIKIPMQGKLESLNASVAAALLMYEVYRQRRI